MAICQVVVFPGWLEKGKEEKTGSKPLETGIVLAEIKLPEAFYLTLRAVEDPNEAGRNAFFPPCVFPVCKGS